MRQYTSDAREHKPREDVAKNAAFQGVITLKPHSSLFPWTIEGYLRVGLLQKDIDEMTERASSLRPKPSSDEISNLIQTCKALRDELDSILHRENSTLLDVILESSEAGEIYIYAYLHIYTHQDSNPCVFKFIFTFQNPETTNEATLVCSNSYPYEQGKKKRT